jgi:hypothetical protein
MYFYFGSGHQMPQSAGSGSNLRSEVVLPGSLEKLSFRGDNMVFQFIKITKKQME